MFNPKTNLSFDKVKETLTSNSFKVYSFNDIYLSSNCFEGNYPTADIKFISQFLIKNNTDCVLVDRVCSVVQYSALYANIKWVGVGACGQTWKVTKSRGHDKRILSPRLENKPILNDKDIIYSIDNSKSIDLLSFGYWVASPYLNISFLPYRFFNASGGSHCLFCPTTLLAAEKKYILITFGNSMPESLQYNILDLLFDNMENLYYEKFVLLTGNNDTTFRYATNKFSIYKNVSIKKWMDYDQAFKYAKLSIGHGGTAHIWYSIAYKVPIIALPAIADQIYNSIRIMKLGIGIGLYSYKGKRRYLPGFFNDLKHLTKEGFCFYIKKYSNVKTDMDMISSRDTDFKSVINGIEKIIN